MGNLADLDHETDHVLGEIVLNLPDDPLHDAWIALEEGAWTFYAQDAAGVNVAYPLTTKRIAALRKCLDYIEPPTAAPALLAEAQQLLDDATALLEDPPRIGQAHGIWVRKMARWHERRRAHRARHAADGGED